MLTKEKKKEIVKDLGKTITNAKSVVFVNFHGLAVNSVNELRRALEAMKVGYVVAKKTLIRRALETQSRFKGEKPTLDGEVAIATGADPILPAKGVYEFKQKVKEGIKILGGFFGGEYVSAEKMEQIAAIPAREVLYG